MALVVNDHHHGVRAKPGGGSPAVPFRLFGHDPPPSGNVFVGALGVEVPRLFGALFSFFRTMTILFGFGHGDQRSNGPVFTSKPTVDEAGRSG